MTHWISNRNYTNLWPNEPQWAPQQCHPPPARPAPTAHLLRNRLSRRARRLCPTPSTSLGFHAHPLGLQQRRRTPLCWQAFCRDKKANWRHFVQDFLLEVSNYPAKHISASNGNCYLIRSARCVDPRVDSGRQLGNSWSMFGPRSTGVSSSWLSIVVGENERASSREET